MDTTNTILAAGIDIGGTNTILCFADQEGNFLFHDQIITNEYSNPAEFVGDIATRINNQLEQHNWLLQGIGIGAPNGNFFTGCIEFAPNLRWEGKVELVKLFSEHFSIPVLLTNDANAAAIGEMIYGAAKNMRDFVVITLGTGLGSGIVSNGRLIYGHDGLAGEIGHTIVDPKGRLCGCGRKGCLETYASATGIIRTLIQYLEERDDNSLLRGIPLKEITSKTIYEAALKGDKLAIEAFDFTCQVLGMKLADTVAFLSPEAIILFGGLANAKEFVFEKTKFYMEQYMLKIYKNKVPVIPSLLHASDAAVLGAAALIWDHKNSKR